MKKLLFTAALIAFCLNSLLAQPCLPEGIEFTTQAQIDSFQVNYPGCTEIEGDVEINGDDISNLNGLNVLTAMGGDLNIRDNDSLTSLVGLQNITSIEGDMIIGTYYSGNTSLSSLTGLENVTSIGGHLWIYGNHSLTSLIGLEGLNSIGGNLQIALNGTLTNLTGIDNVSSIGGDIIIGGYGLTSLTGLENLSSIQGNLVIGFGFGMGTYQSNPNLISLTALENVTSIGGGLGIQLCPILTSLTGLENLTSIGGVYIAGNDSLTSLTGLGNVTSIGGNLGIIYNGSLTSLTGLEGLNEIGGNLWIGEPSAGNSSLTSLSGLENLTSIGGYLNIYDNDTLTSLTGLDNLISIGGDLNIGGIYADNGNPALTDISSLGNLSAASINNLKIRYNNSLSTCDIQSICEYLASPNGTVTISNNAPGCNSQQEVEEACDSIQTQVSLFEIENEIRISPNPVESSALIEYTLYQPSPVSLQILDVSGQVVVTLINDQQHQGEQKVAIDASGLKPGVYFCVLKTNEGIQTKKIIKL